MHAYLLGLEFAVKALASACIIIKPQDTAAVYSTNNTPLLHLYTLVSAIKKLDQIHFAFLVIDTHGSLCDIVYMLFSFKKRPVWDHIHINHLLEVWSVLRSGFVSSMFYISTLSNAYQL